MVYAKAMGNLAALGRSHADARDAVAGFCAAHKKLVEAAADGRLSKSETHAAVVEAVKSSRPAKDSNAPGGEPAKK